MEPVVINQHAGRVSELLKDKLGAKGTSLERQLAFVRRGLPRRVRRSGEALVNAQKMGQSPQLAMRVDSADFSKSYDDISRYLGEIDAAAERSRKRYNMLAAIAGQVLLVGCCFVGFLMWRGYI